jgi:hypothetical protein
LLQFLKKVPGVEAQRFLSRIFYHLFDASHRKQLQLDTSLVPELSVASLLQVRVLHACRPLSDLLTTLAA